MKRKTSSTPSCVYKYRMYSPQGDTADRTADSFVGARVHYNKLITIEKGRREKYRAVRSRLFPELAALEAKRRALEEQIKAAREEVQSDKVTSRSRDVDQEKRATIAGLVLQKKAMLVELRAARAACADSPELAAAAKVIDDAAKQAIKDLRPETYWGTYLLVEAAAQAAKGAAADPEYNLDPPHLLKSRIGVHFCGGEDPAEVVGGGSRLLRIAPARFRLTRHDDEIATGKAARTTAQIRIGSEGREPVWATLPMVMHRPIPSDARIKDAYVTRERYTVRTPWQYHLCVCLESPSFQRTLPGIKQEGTTTINFGWRSTKRGIRVAMLNREGQTPEEVLLPPSYIALERKRRDLTSILATNFNGAKSALSEWMHNHDCPEAFREAFASLAQWRSQHRFAELMDYWQEHRIDGDAEIFAALAAREDPRARAGRKAREPWRAGDIARASWMVRYRHLQTWLDSVRRKLDNWKDNFYRCIAKKLATTSAKLCVEVFDMRQVAKRPEAEEPENQGDERARSNRQLAGVSDLRLKIMQAAAKYHCEAVAVPAPNNTRRCDVCGELHLWDPKLSIDHVCANPTCGAEWDQDVNNTDRQHSRIASGEVVPMVTPAERSENGQVVGAKTSTYGGAREALAKTAKGG